MRGRDGTLRQSCVEYEAVLVGRNVMVMVEKAINDQWIVFNFHEACLQMKELCRLDVIKISRNEVAHELGGVWLEGLKISL